MLLVSGDAVVVTTADVVDSGVGAGIVSGTKLVLFEGVGQI